MLEGFAIGAADAHAATAAVGDALEQRLAIHLHAVHALALEVRVVVVEEPSDRLGAHEADKASPPLLVEPRDVRHYALAKSTHLFPDVIRRQALARYAAPITDDSVPHQERLDSEFCFGHPNGG